MSIRKRLPSEESRRIALQAARALLIEAGPQAVTLKAVAARVGRTHANLLHHFGSAADLQKELAAHLAATVCETIADAVRATRAGIGSPREVVDLTFDAFDREGGGALVSWMQLTGNDDALDPTSKRSTAWSTKCIRRRRSRGSSARCTRRPRRWSCLRSATR